MSKLSALVLFIAGAVSGLAQVAISPPRQLRDINALYLSPYTVDAGHVQIDSYIVGYSYQPDAASYSDLRTTAWNIAPTRLKVGVLHNFDCEVAIRPYTNPFLGVSFRL